MTDPAADPAAVLRRVARAVFRVPEPMTPADWADAHAYFVVDRRPVKYRTQSDPYARTILNLAERPGLRELVVMKAEQVGGTTRLNAYLGYTVDRAPAATMIVYPNATAAGRQNLEKITPAVMATPCLRARVGPRARDAKTLAITFDRMRLTMVGAPPGQRIDANLEAHSYGRVFIDECDRCHPNVVDVVEGRGKVRQRFLLWVQGTPEYAGQGIDRRYNGAEDLPPSDRGRFSLPCPLDDCRQYHVREFRHVRWPGKDKDGNEIDDSRDPHADPETVLRLAWYRCPHCKGKVTAEHNLWQAQRHVLLTAGQTIGPWRTAKDGTFVPGTIEGPPSTSPRAGVHQGGLYTCLPPDINPYGYVAEGFVRAKGRATQTWVNRRLGEAWSVRGESVEAKDLRSLCTPVSAGGYRMGTVPAWCLLLLASVDVQAGGGGSAWVSIYGVGEGARDRCLVWFGNVRWPAHTTGSAVDEAVDRVFTRTDGRRMRAAAEFVDEGDRTDEVVARARRRKAAGRPSNTVKGTGLGGGAEALGLHAWGWIDRRPDGTAETRGPRRLRVNVHAWKRACHRMMRPAGTGESDEEQLLGQLGEGAVFASSGRLFLPEDAPEAYVRQMVAEQLAPVKARGSGRVTWKYQLRPGYPDNHAFDAFVYFTAAVDAMTELRQIRAEPPPPTSGVRAPPPPPPTIGQSLVRQQRYQSLLGRRPQ